jgi:hypothetical protein
MKKTSEKQDVGGEDFDKLLGFLSEGDEGSVTDDPIKHDLNAFKALLATPAQNRRALKGYLQQAWSTFQTEKGELVKKAA